MDRDIALEALGALCNANVTSVQKQGAQVQFRAQSAQFQDSFQAQPERLSINNLIPLVLEGDEQSQGATLHFSSLQSDLTGGAQRVQASECDIQIPQERCQVIDEDDFFDPRFDYDFRCLQDVETFRRGGEVYERPCGWQRFALKILDKYQDNTWLGTSYRSTQSVPGEWPVSYHGTSKAGADGIISGFYKAGSGQVYGRGIYSTPYLSHANQYAKCFTSKKTGRRYKVILQNRINPQYREIHFNGNYWLVPIPHGTSECGEQMMVERAIRPYGLLLKEF